MGDTSTREGWYARAIYFLASCQQIVIVRVFTKKTQKTPCREIELATNCMKAFLTEGSDNYKHK